jgi:hypothetical protein
MSSNLALYAVQLYGHDVPIAIRAVSSDHALARAQDFAFTTATGIVTLIPETAGNATSSR